MKTFFYVMSIIIIIILGCWGFTTNFNSGRTTIIVKKESDYYQMTASYNKDKQPQVEKYINAACGQKVMFNDSGNISKEVVLKDGNRFSLKYSPGTLYIKINIAESSPEFIHRIKQVFQAINGVINT